MKALVTGATSGIGLEMAYNLAERGIDLFLASRNDNKMKTIAEELSPKVKVDYFAIDLSKEKSASLLYETVLERGHEIDILINNSGYGLFGKNNDFSPVLLEEMVILNCVTLTTLSRLFGKDMATRGRGYIMNVASTAAYQPIPYFSAYSASKSFVMRFSKALHHELKREGVSVTCLNPGPTATNFFEMALSGEKFPLFKGKPMMSAKEVAEVGINAMFSRKTVVVAGLMNKVFSIILPLAPLVLVEKVLSRYVKRY